MASDEIHYQAMLARDARFDGKFFVGVKTTGIYCRPICPARPKRRNVEFFPDARAAERAGYRPCLRCRPEAAPGSPAWNASAALVQRALRALSDPGEDADPGGEAFASRFGVGARHLRRLFLAEVGRTPARIAADLRLDFARKLIAETGLPMARIAGAAGFASVRRFNAAIRERFRRPPTEMRRRRAPADGAGVELSLPFRPPFDWEAALDYYRSHAIAGLEAFPDGAYERIFRFGEGPAGHVRVTLGAGAGLRIRVRGGRADDLARVARAVRRMFDLDADPRTVAEAFARAPGLERLRRARPGLRAPRGWDPFETAVCAVLGQLVSLPQANRLIARLLRACGEPIAHPLGGGIVHLFPSPAALARADLGSVGTTSARRAALRELAARAAEGSLSFSSAQDPAAFRAALRSIKGIGPWTAEYVSLRAIADADAFPAADLVLRRAVRADPALNPESVRPWRGYAAAHLWRAWSLRRKEEP